MRTQALQMVTKPLRQTATALGLAFALTPLAVVLGIGTFVIGNPLRLIRAILGVVGLATSDASIDWSKVGGGLLAWTILIWAILAVSGGWILFRQLRRYLSLAPSIKNGTEHHGVAVDIDRNTRKNAGGISFISMSVQFDFAGSLLYGFLEEPIGTELPKLRKGAQVTAWLLGESGAVFWDDGFMPASTSPIVK